MAGVIKEATQEVEANIARNRYQRGSRIATEDDENDEFDVKRTEVFEIAQKLIHAKEGKSWMRKRYI